MTAPDPGPRAESEMTDGFEQQTTRTALLQATSKLRIAGVPDAEHTANLLLRHSLDRDAHWIAAHAGEPLTEPQAKCLFELVERRASGEPTAYVVRQHVFMELPFEVTSDVFIPRPATEVVVQIAIERFNAAFSDSTSGRPANAAVADVGTGCGCIAVVLARRLPDATVHATDVSVAALQVARRNAVRHQVESRCRFVQCSLLSGVVPDSMLPRPGFDLIVSNPPYLGRKAAHNLSREVRDHEPAVALYGGEQGYELYAALIEEAAAHLRPGGILVLELGHNSLPGIRSLTHDARWKGAAVTLDRSGFPRVVAVQRA
jgi:release factor glutamine methyltransferase